jgi:mRNA interferase HigB
MIVLGVAVLEEAKRVYPYAKSAISRWKTITEGAVWKGFEDIKQHFNAPDRVGKCVVFDIKHDNFRLIAIVEYARATVIVKDFLKHSDYDKDRWKNECCG